MDGRIGAQANIPIDMELHADCYPSYAAVYQPNAKHFLANKLVSRAHVFLQLQVSCSYCTPQRAQIRVQGRTVAVAKHQSESTSITASQRYAMCAERHKTSPGPSATNKAAALSATHGRSTCEAAVGQTANLRMTQAGGWDAGALYAPQQR